MTCSAIARRIHHEIWVPTYLLHPAGTHMRWALRAGHFHALETGHHLQTCTAAKSFSLLRYIGIGMCLGWMLHMDSLRHQGECRTCMRFLLSHHHSLSATTPALDLDTVPPQAQPASHPTPSSTTRHLARENVSAWHLQ